ncbi:MAG: hypothetical protein QW835_07745 [Candidatus Hadarchaeum sp.]
MSVTVPLIEIKLDKVRHLRLDFNALAKAEEVTGKSFLTSEGLSWATTSAKGLRALIWACLLHEDPDLTLEEVGGLLNYANVPQITAALSKLWEKSVPESEDNSPLAESPQPGSNSGP